MYYKYLLFFLFFLGFRLTASADFNFNTRCVEAYKDVLRLKLNEARAIIREEKQLDPKNGITILLDNYVDYYSLIASESKSDYERLKDLRSKRLDALEEMDKNSPYYLFTQAEIYLQWGLLKARFAEYPSSCWDIKKARGLLKENAEKYPDFLPDQKSLALIEVLFGSLPSNIKSIVKFFGISGNMQYGVSQLEKLRSELPNTKFNYYGDEVAFYLCYIDVDVLHHTGNYDRLMSYIAGMDNQSLLRTYLEGYIAEKTAHNDQAIASLESIKRSASYEVLPAADYLLGNAKLCRMDSNANAYLLRYINEYKGIHNIKDVYLKLAFYYLLNNDPAKYAYYIQQVRVKGYDIDEKDKQAIKEANDAQPDIDLLKARLFFDGGYYTRALERLKDKQVNDFKLLRDKIEFSYRLGRIYEKLEKLDDAVANYQKAINSGRNTTYYYASNSALNMGVIFERERDYNKAAYYYKQAIDMKDHEYQNSIQSQAEEGLQRIHR